MCEFAINIRTIQDVQEFANITGTLPYEIDLVSGQYTVDGKSIMGILSLSMDKYIQCIAYADREEVSPFLKKIGKFLCGPITEI